MAALGSDRADRSDGVLLPDARRSGGTFEATVMNQCQLMALSILTPLILGGCVHTDLPAQVVPPAAVGTAKLPLKVAVLDDPLLTVHEPLGFYEKLNPSLANTVRDALAVYFETVLVVDETQSVAAEDLFATLNYSTSPLKLTVTFVQPKIGGKQL